MGTGTWPSASAAAPPAVRKSRRCWEEARQATSDKRRANTIQKWGRGSVGRVSLAEHYNSTRLSGREKQKQHSLHTRELEKTSLTTIAQKRSFPKKIPMSAITIHTTPHHTPPHHHVAPHRTAPTLPHPTAPHRTTPHTTPPHPTHHPTLYPTPHRATPNHTTPHRLTWPDARTRPRRNRRNRQSPSSPSRHPLLRCRRPRAADTPGALSSTCWPTLRVQRIRKQPVRGNNQR